MNLNELKMNLNELIALIDWGAGEGEARERGGAAAGGAEGLRSQFGGDCHVIAM